MSDMEDRTATENGRQALSASLAPTSSNTGATNSQIPDISTGGVDYLEASVWAGISLDPWENLSATLETAQEVAQASPNNRTLWRFKGAHFTVLGHSIGQGIRCKYAIEYKGIVIGITSEGRYRESRPNIRVYVKSNFLMVHGHERAWEVVQEFLAELGFEVIRTTVSRIDTCSDLVGVQVREFVTAFLNDQCIKRARFWNVFGEGQYSDVTGLVVGKQIRMRIYDKVAECRDDFVKRDIMIERRWGCEPEAATRVEFQLRGEELKEHFCEAPSVEAVFAALPKINEWLTEKWVRFVDDCDRANGHQSRAQCSELWSKVCESFSSWAGECKETWLKPVKRSRDISKPLVKQAVGCLAKAVALRDHIDTRESFVEAVKDLLWEEHGVMYQKFKTKAEEVANTVLGPAVDLSTVPF